MTKRHKWTANEDTCIRDLYPTIETNVLANMLGVSLPVLWQRANKLGVKKTTEFKSTTYGAVLKNAGVNTRFKAGQKSWNKGMKGLQIGGTETQFKPGHKSLNARPVGSTRICSKDNYTLIKMREGHHPWQQLHRVIYLRMHGKLAKGHVVSFVDGNKHNISITNLSSLTKGQIAINNGIAKYPQHVQDQIRMRAALNRRINQLCKQNQTQQTA